MKLIRYLNEKKEWTVSVLISLIFIIINIIRILIIPITHDEAWTRSLLSGSYHDLLYYTNLTTNNHILNSLIAKFFIEIFKDNVFFLRLGNLLAQINYLIFSFLILSIVIKDFWWKIAIFLLLNLNPILFEFWGMCRGYGLAISNMITCIYFLTSYLLNRKNYAIIMTFIFSMLSVYSNLSNLNFYLAVPICVILDLILNYNKKRIKIFIIKELPIVILSGLIMFYTLYRLIIKFQKDGQIFGGDTSFIHDTLKSLLHVTFLLDVDSLFIKIATLFVLITSVVPLIYWIVQIYKKNKEYIMGCTFSCLLLVPCISICLQHQLFQSKFAMERTALFFVPLYFLHLGYFLYCFDKEVKLFSKVILFFTLCISLFYFYQKVDLTTILLWWYDKNNIVVLDRIINENKDKKNSKINLRTHWLFYPSINYYIEHDYKPYFNATICSKDMPKNDTSYDYYYVCQEDLASLPKNYKEDTIFMGSYYLMKKSK